jgi:Xaa-Pro dipeptidase
MVGTQMEEEIARRVGRFQEELKTHGMDGALMVQKSDLYYLSGTDQDAHLWVPAEGDPILMVRKSMERALRDASIRTVVPLAGFSQLPGLIRENTGFSPSRLGLEMDAIPAAFYLNYRKHFKGTVLMDVSPLIRSVRMIKSAYEIACIARAAEMADRMYEEIPGYLEEGMREIDLAAKVEACYRRMGHAGLVRTRGFNMECLYGQIMAGRSGAVASNSPGPTGGRGPGAFYSQGAGMDRIGAHEPIFIDYAANMEGYIADQTRIFSMGRLDDTFHRAHDAMLTIQNAVAEKGRPGVVAGDLYALALHLAEQSGFGEGFMGHPDPVPFVAHGVGLDIDEWPVMGRGSETRLREGMTLALEPKVVIPGKGVVGIENTWVVTETGMTRLNRFPDTIQECS